MTATFTIPVIVVIPGQLITASLWNNEWTNIYNNLTPSGVDTYSTTDSQMQTSTDPFPGGSTSRATSLAGELERIRYILNLIIGGTYWYNHPPIDLTTLNTSTPVIPSGTVMVFYQASAPTGWTQVTTHNDKALRVVSGTGGGSGGTTVFSSAIGLAHSHTVAAHTHDLANHTHTMGNHTHTSAAHTHTVPRNGWGATASTLTGQIAVSPNGGGATSTGTGDNTSGSTTPGATGGPSTNTSDGPSTNTSGSSGSTTDTQLGDFPGYKYIDVIVATKS